MSSTLHHKDYLSSAPCTEVSTQRHAIREFIDWYCSEPRLAFNITVVTRQRIFLASKHTMQPQRINLPLKAVRRLRASERKGFESGTTLRGVRDYAMIAVLLGCGLRRTELATVTVGISSGERAVGVC